MKKLLAVGAALCPMMLSLVLLSGCALYGNDRSRIGTMGVHEEGDTVYFSLPMESFYVGSGEIRLAFDRAENTLSLAENEVECEPVSECVLWGDTFPLDVLEAAEGYEKLAEKVETLDSRNEKYLTAFATKTADMVYGFCVIYKNATGFRSGLGQIDAKKVVRSILFSYDREGTFSVLSTLEDRIVVAFDGENAVYYYKEKYYLGDLSGKKEQYLCDDAAYDKGLTSHSGAVFFEGGEWCVLYFHHRVDSEAKSFEKYVVTDMGGTFYAELKLPHDPTW